MTLQWAARWAWPYLAEEPRRVGVLALRLYIIRHGKAYVDSPTGRDEDRELKSRGREQAEHLGTLLRDSSHRPTLILSSPVLRAAESARLINERVAATLEVRDGLSTAGNERGAFAEIQRVASGDSVAVVGHNPTLETLVAILCRPASAEFDGLRTGQCVVIDFDGLMGPRLGRFVESLRLGGQDD